MSQTFQHEGDVFAWKYLRWRDTYLTSPHRNTVWKSPHKTADCPHVAGKVPEGHKCGIYAYWTYSDCFERESFPIANVQSVVARLKLSGEVAVALFGVRAEAVEIVELYAHTDLIPLLGFQFPAVPVHELTRSTPRSYRKENREKILAQLGITIPTPAPVPKTAQPNITTPPRQFPLPSSSGGQPLANFRYGVYANPGPFVGRTVAEVRQHLHGLWQVPNDAVAFKGKQRLDDSYVVHDGENIEFHRRQQGM